MKISSQQYLIISATDLDSLEGLVDSFAMHLAVTSFDSMYILHHQNDRKNISSWLFNTQLFKSESLDNLISNAQWVALPKLKNQEDQFNYKDALSSIVYSLTRNANSVLAVNLLGADSTLYYYLSVFLSLYGRPQDDFNHFYLDQDEIRQVKIPFFQLKNNHNVPKPVTGNLADTKIALSDKRLRIDLSTKKLYVDEIELKLPPALFIWYSWIAIRKKKLVDEYNAGVSSREAHHLDYMNHFKRIFGAHHHICMKVEEALKKDDGFTSNYMSEKKNRVNKVIKQSLNHDCEEFLIQLVGEWGSRRYCLGLPADKIIIEPAANNL